MHTDLKADTTRPPAADTAAQQIRFDAWRAAFNTARPHEALGGVVPSSLYGPSGRALPHVLPAPEYAGYAEVRRVSLPEAIRFEGREVFVSGVLARASVALTSLDERDFKLRG